MDTGVKYSKIHFANIILENDFGYHLESLWYGTEVYNFVLMILDTMKSWYEPNKDVMGPEIRDFHNMLEKAAEEGDDTTITFNKLKGEKFHSNGLKMNIEITNVLDEMYAFVFNEAFAIFAVNGEKPEDFNSVKGLIDYLDEKYEVDEPIMQALRNPEENSIATAIYLIDIKYQYSMHHFNPGHKPQQEKI